MLSVLLTTEITEITETAKILPDFVDYDHFSNFDNSLVYYKSGTKHRQLIAKSWTDNYTFFFNRFR